MIERRIVLALLLLAILTPAAYCQETDEESTSVYDDEDKQAGDSDKHEKKSREKDQFWFGLSANLNLVYINLTTRKYEMGFNPGIAYGFKWKPEWWEFTHSFLSVDLLFSATFRDFDDVSDPDYFDITLVPVLTIIDTLSAGLGFSYKLALKESAKDTLEIIFSFSLSMSVGGGGSESKTEETGDEESEEYEEYDD